MTYLARIRSAAGGLLIALPLLALPHFAVAQTQVSQAADVPQAPIGHRQPTASDVPTNDSVTGDDSLKIGDNANKPFGPALRALPKLDVKATCRRAQPLSAGEKSAFDGCLNDELAAQKQLSRTWFSFKPNSRTTCTQETKIGGAPSYVELVTCLELDKQATEAENDNKKALTMPSTSSTPLPNVSPSK